MINGTEILEKSMFAELLRKKQNTDGQHIQEDKHIYPAYYTDRLIYDFTLSPPHHRFSLFFLNSLSLFNWRMSQLFAGLTSMSVNPFDGSKLDDSLQSYYGRLRHRLNMKMDQEFRGEMF